MLSRFLPKKLPKGGFFFFILFLCLLSLFDCTERPLPRISYYLSPSETAEPVHRLEINEKSPKTVVFLRQDYEYPLIRRQTIIDPPGAAFGIEQLIFTVRPQADNRCQFYIEGIPNPFVKNAPYTLYKDDLILPTTVNGETVFDAAHVIASRTVYPQGDNDIRGDTAALTVIFSVTPDSEP